MNTIIPFMNDSDNTSQKEGLGANVTIDSPSGPAQVFQDLLKIVAVRRITEQHIEKRICFSTLKPDRRTLGRNVSQELVVHVDSNHIGNVPHALAGYPPIMRAREMETDILRLKPRTRLAEKYQEIRRRILEAGKPLMDIEEIQSEVDNLRRRHIHEGDD